MAVIEVKNVSKKYRLYYEKRPSLKEMFLFRGRGKWEDFWVLNDISLEIEKGTTVGLIGQNGSGKSTLLKLLTKIIYPDQGEIKISDRVSSLLELGAGFHPDFTGRENIYFNSSVFGLTKEEIDKRIDDIIKFSELEEFIDNPVRSYSSGMYMRLAFATAIDVEPDVLLVDEVLAVGDTSFQRKCTNKFLELKEKGTTIIIVSHDLSTIGKLCSQVIWLNEGKLMAQGNTDYVLDLYYEYLFKESQRKNMENNKKEIVLRYDSSTTEVAEDSKDSQEEGNDEPDLNQDPNEEDQEEDRNQEEDQDLEQEVVGNNNPNRWGSGEVEILNPRILDGTRNERYVFKPGETIQIAYEFVVHQDVKEPVFGIGVFLPDGTRCYGTNTLLENIDIGELKKGLRGTTLFTIEDTSFVNGTYFLNVAVHSPEGYAYDYLNRVFSFEIQSPLEDIGVYRPHHKWTVTINQ